MNMARIAGVDLPENKPVAYALPYIYGVGLKRSHDILGKLDIQSDKRVKNLSEEEAAAIQREITSAYNVEGELRKQVRTNIKRLQEIGSVRGDRHKRSLPLRGQRTKTNARTRKGHRKKGAGMAKK